MRGTRHLLAFTALSAVLAAAPLAAAAPVPLDALRRSAATAQSRWSSAAERLADTRATQSALEHRVAALKRLNERQPRANHAELERLLRESLEADRALEAQKAEVARLEAAFRQALRDAVGAIDGEIRALVPGLQTGTLDARKSAARRINELRAARDELRGELAAVASGPSSGRWGRLSVEIEPLDGPSELNEKADIVEDTRDKLRAKRRALDGLLREARQEREIARAARDFSTDVSLFDEESRVGRVLRGGGPRAAASDAQRAPNSGGGEELGVAGQPDPTGAFAESHDSTGGARGPAAPGFSADPAPPAPVAPPASNAPPVQIPSVSRELSPELLMRLRIEELAASKLDVATLEQLVAELERTERFLAKEATRIRQRAEQLEEDETKALGQ